MKAFHTLRTHRADDNFFLHDFELFAMLLSALEWRRHNGSIELVTDRVGADYIHRHGLDGAWDEITVSLDAMERLLIDEDIFWAGAKLYALSQHSAPCIMMDLDFIVWRPLDFEPYGTDIAVIHREYIDPSIYPPRRFFNFIDGWQLPPQLDWTVKPCNSAFAYFGSDKFVERYTSFALEFMQKTDPRGAGLPNMVFVEQRWLAMCAAHFDKTVHEISSLPELFGERQKFFTHLWGYKNELRNDRKLAKKFCFDCADRLKHDFADFAENLRAQEWAAKYF